MYGSIAWPFVRASLAASYAPKLGWVCVEASPKYHHEHFLLHVLWSSWAASSSALAEGAVQTLHGPAGRALAAASAPARLRRRDRVRLRAGGAGGAGGAGALVGRRAVRRDAHQRRGSEQLVPSDHDVGQVEVVEHDLRDAHEHLLALHAAVVAPNGHLKYESVDRETIFHE